MIPTHIYGPTFAKCAIRAKVAVCIRFEYHIPFCIFHCEKANTSVVFILHCLDSSPNYFAYIFFCLTFSFVAFALNRVVLLQIVLFNNRKTQKATENWMKLQESWSNINYQENMKCELCSNIFLCCWHSHALLGLYFVGLQQNDERYREREKPFFLFGSSKATNSLRNKLLCK